jgi:hypothetical protein
MSMLTHKHLRLIGALGDSGWYISPHGYNLYRAGANDTLDGIADRWLGDPSKSDEIWNLQTPGWRAKRGNPNNLQPGDELLMPQAAIDRAKSEGVISGGKGQGPSKILSGKTEVQSTDVLKPSTGEVHPTVPSGPVGPAKLPDAPVAKSDSSFGKVLLFGGLGLAGAGGAIALAVHLHKKMKRSNPAKQRRGRSFRRRFVNAADGA